MDFCCVLNVYVFNILKICSSISIFRDYKMNLMRKMWSSPKLPSFITEKSSISQCCLHSQNWEVSIRDDNIYLYRSRAMEIISFKQLRRWCWCNNSIPTWKERSRYTTITRESSCPRDSCSYTSMCSLCTYVQRSVDYMGIQTEAIPMHFRNETC